jgi:hypothetical protein
LHTLQSFFKLTRDGNDLTTAMFFDPLIDFGKEFAAFADKVFL